MHKNPSKAGFIIAAPNCPTSVKPLSKAVTAELKLIYKEIENHNFKTQHHSGVKTFRPVQSNQNIIDTINILNYIPCFFTINRPSFHLR